ncbi:hypothetical protein [Cellulomonas sp. SG140]|uniref:hypothetical protein n=1 Tax=Cellulomonas sp. SG140 TaxID=2976536 RepID=UPI0021E9A9A3|nr:hypothetical protein [Cellulomonas sp. SG140]
MGTADGWALMGAAGRDRRVRGRTLAAWTATVVAVVAAVALGPVLWLEVDEGATPPVSAARLPAGVEEVGQERQCGSGGCWWQLALEPATGAQDDVLAAGSRETCAARSWIDRRTVCTGVQLHGGRLTAYVRYQRLSDLG